MSDRTIGDGSPDQERCRKSQNPFCGTDWVRVRDDVPVLRVRGLVGEIMWLSLVELDDGKECAAFYLRIPSVGKYSRIPEAWCEPMFDVAEITASQRPAPSYEQAGLL